jgi:hypothetical protein
VGKSDKKTRILKGFERNKPSKTKKLGSFISSGCWIYYGICALAVTSLSYVSLGKWGVLFGLLGSGIVGLITKKGLGLLENA